MKYQGSKRRIAKDIIPIILKNRKDGQHYVEPFCGGCNVIDKVTNHRIASDSNKYLIAYLQEIQKGWIPPRSVDFEQYQLCRSNPLNYPNHLIGYIGFCMSYGAKFFGGFRRDPTQKRDYALEAFRNYEKQLPGLTGIEFQFCNYYDLQIPEKSIIYCDPPYRNTENYSNSKHFDYEQYYDWCRLQVSKGHEIYCSEYIMPDDFKVVFEKEICSSLDLNTRDKKATEKLYTLIGEYHDR